ncbi:MAG: glycosyl hydrolase family 95 catalytic domain-containing protein [Chitinophagaceae bacterium]|jgi:alpha-L-fucosidase 2
MRFFLFALTLAVSFFSKAQPIDSTEWSNYMKHTQLFWDSLGTDFYDGIIMGNGRLGVNMYKESDRTLRFNVGRSDVTDTRPHYPDSMFTQQLVSHPRLPIGKLLIKTEGSVVSSSIVLDIYNAEARGEVITSKGKVKLFFFVPSGEEVIHVEATTEGSEKLICEWTAEKSMTPRFSLSRVKAETFQYKENPPFEIKDSAGYGICLQPLLYKGEYATVWKHQVKKDIHIIDLAVGYHPEQRGKAIPEAVAAIRNFYSRDLSKIITLHRKWWNNFFQKSFITIPDKRLETYYWLQLYKLGSATRANKPMIDLMGPWFTSKTPWPGIWWNLNQQLTYSPLFTSNHLELTKPLFDLLNKNLQNLINNIPEKWRNDAAAIGRITTFDLIAPLNQNDLRSGRFEPGNLTWMMLYYYKYFQYSGDQKELQQRIYPLLKRSVNYLIHLLYLDDKGVYHLVRSHSPEFADAEDAHYSLSALIWGLQTLIKMNDRFAVNDPDKKRWREVLQKLTPLPSNEKGFMIGKDVELSASHRHFSHLMAIYPFRLLNMEDPKHRDIAIRSINHWHSMPAALAGYSYTGASSMSSLLGDGDRSVKYLRDFLNRHAKPGGLYAEAGPCFETPMAFAASLLEMLIDSDDGRIRIFPAVPFDWKELSFKDLAAEGAFRVSAVMYEGEVHQIQIKSLAGNRCTLVFKSLSEFDLVSDQRGIIIPQKTATGMETTLGFDTRKGETITLKRKRLDSVNNLLVHFKEGDFQWGLNSNYLRNGNLKVRPFFIP